LIINDLAKSGKTPVAAVFEGLHPTITYSG